MTFKHFIVATILALILLSGCAHYEVEPPLSGEAAPPIESTGYPENQGTVGTGGGTVLDESEW